MKNKALSVFVLLMMVVGLFSPATAVGRAQAAEAPEVKWVTFKYDDYSDASLNQLIQMNGSAFINGTALRLTSNTGGQAGSVFSKQRIYNSGNNYSFSTFFKFQISSPGGDGSFAIGADGITFAIQTVSNTAGGVGSGIGIGGVNPSVAVKFDTFNNATIGNLHDPSDNYIGLETNGNVDNTNPSWYKAIPKAQVDMKDGNVHYAWIDYDGNAKTMSVYLSNDPTRPATPVLTAPGVDLASYFNGADGVFAGFTSATGSSWENHDILSWYFQNKLDPIDTQNTNYVYKQAPSQVSVSNSVYSESEPGKTKISASALDENGQPVAGVPITFHTGSGTIEDLDGNPIMPVPAVVSTDANGKAEAILDMGSQPNTNPGQITIAAEGGAYKSLPLPPSPTLSKSNATGTGLTLNWSPVPGATAYHIFDNSQPIADVASTTYAVTGLDPDASDMYTVTADVNGLQSAPSNAVSAATPVPGLTATPSPGSQPGTTKVSATAGTDNHLVTKVSSDPIATPNIGSKAPSGDGVTDPYTSGDDIGGVDAGTHKYIGVYEVDGNDNIVAFKLITLNGNEISPLPAPELDVTPFVGSQPGTVQMSAEAGGGHHLVAKVSSSPIATPNVGDPAPTGQGVTDPYASGTDIGGVDLATNKYVAVYEVDDNNQVVAFKLITLDEYYTNLKLELSSGTLQVGDTQSVDIKAVYLDQSTTDVTDEASYSSSDPTVATVDSHGVITAKGTGTTVITVTYGGKVVTKTIQVQSGEPNITLKLDGPNAVVGDGRTPITLTATVVNKSDGSPVAGSPVTFNGISDGSKTVETDSHGIATVTFTPQAIVGVTPVHHLITASATDSNGLTVEKNIGVDYMPASIHGVLIDQVTGQPIQNAVVTVQADFNGDGVVDFSQQVVTGPDGAYQIVVPRGNWTYTLNIQTPVTIDGKPTMLQKTQTVEVGAIGTGQQLPTENKISGQLIVSHASANASQPRPSLDDLFGSGNVKALVENIGGSSYHAEAPLDADGNFDVNQVPQGRYKISYQIKTPEGVQLAGPSLTVEVSHNGEMGVVYSLIDPYGVVTDAATGRPLSGVTMSLYWADTDLNKSNGHQPNTLVQLPALSNFQPNQNANTQTTDTAGEYAWMVFPSGDYYIVAQKDGYYTYNTLNAKTTVPAAPGSDSYIDNGIIHVGQDLVALSFSLSPISVSGGGAVPSAPTGLSVSNVTSSGAELSWQAISGASSYNVYDNGKLIAAGVTGTSYSVKGLAAGTQHAFTITAVVNGVESPQSQSQTVTLAAAQNGSEGHHEAYILGYPDGTFKPERDVTRQEVAALLARAFHLQTADASQTGYKDVKAADWGAEAIAAVTKAGYMSGYPDGTFRPNQPISREELAATAARIKQLKGEGTDAFSDVADGWAKAAIDSAAAESILTGYPDGTFRPKANITRAEAVTIINRLLGRGPLTGVSTPTWSDVTPNNWAFGQIEEASKDHDYTMQDGKEVETK